MEATFFYYDNYFCEFTYLLKMWDYLKVFLFPHLAVK